MWMAPNEQGVEVTALGIGNTKLSLQWNYMKN